MAESQEKIHPVDAHVGKRLRLRRKSLDMSQEKLGASVGLTFQQVQKYENGANRISASRLHDMAKVLETPISYFFEGLTNLYQPPILVNEERAEYRISIDTEPKGDVKELISLFYEISDPKLRQQILSMARDFAGKL